MECFFCKIDKDRIVIESEFGIAIRDAYPVSPGHTLVISKRHIGSYFELNKPEREDLLELLEQTKKEVDKKFKPDAYNIGINDGQAAGQTVHHVHIHLIPRYEADVADPRGGVRWIFQDKAKYWE